MKHFLTIAVMVILSALVPTRASSQTVISTLMKGEKPETVEGICRINAGRWREGTRTITVRCNYNKIQRGTGKEEFTISVSRDDFPEEEYPRGVHFAVEVLIFTTEEAGKLLFKNSDLRMNGIKVPFKARKL